MKNISKIIFSLISALAGFIAFFSVVVLGELFSGSFINSYGFHFEPVHFQIALLGGILQGSLYLFKSISKNE